MQINACCKDKNKYFYKLYPHNSRNMTEKESALHSSYIIDGIRWDTTPAELLEECSDEITESLSGSDGHADIIDESTDPPVTSFTYSDEFISDYIKSCNGARGTERSFRMLYPGAFTRQRIAGTLTDRLWNKGHYRLGDLRIWAKWIWNTRPLGNMAAFYLSVEAASTYLFDLGVKLNGYIFEETDEDSHAQFYAWLPEKETQEEEDITDELNFKESPYESHHPWIADERKCRDTILADISSKIIYIPFDTCSYRIGGTLLAQVHGHNGGIGPNIKDPDYFIDCFEVVRELVEDGIIIAGVTVGDGGLATAAAAMCGKHGIDLDIEGILTSYQETDRTKVLFGEVPGVLLQISDNDMDYLDSQLLLQDVAYYPVGIPAESHKGVVISQTDRKGVAGILASLMGQASEGED